MSDCGNLNEQLLKCPRKAHQQYVMRAEQLPRKTRSEESESLYLPTIYNTFVSSEVRV